MCNESASIHTYRMFAWKPAQPAGKFRVSKYGEVECHEFRTFFLTLDIDQA